jgi:hypothetical protein
MLDLPWRRIAGPGNGAAAERRIVPQQLVGQSLNDLFARIKTTMPANDPGSLSSAETL